jgi:alpha-tubulin suppressor-like RCC1 family protein
MNKRVESTGGRPVGLEVLGLLGVLGAVVAGLCSGVPGPAHADQSDSAVRRVAAASIATDSQHTCALMATGDVRCWGDGHYGELGYNSRRDVGDDPARRVETAGNVPVGGKVTAITTGENYTCALLTTGRVRCWGWGDTALGYNNLDNVGDSPRRSIQKAGNVPIGGKVTAISAGAWHACALLTTGHVRCWGLGELGELGHNTRHSVGDGSGDLSIKQAGNVPVGGKVTAIATGDFHTCALLTTGRVRCWGQGDLGELGYGKSHNVGDGAGDLTIKQAGNVPVGGKVTAISAGGDDTCALLTTGRVRCWGWNFEGELGHDNPVSIGDGHGHPSIKEAGNVPVGGKVTAISVSRYHTCAVLTTSAIRCWGASNYGQLGHDSLDNIGDGRGSDLSIRQAGDLPVGGRVRAISAGGQGTCAVLTTGAVRCWGRNHQGELGHDNTTDIGGGGGEPSIEDAGDVPVPSARVRAFTRLSAGVTPTRDLHAPYAYRVGGRVRGRFVADAATCTGHVEVVVHGGGRLLDRRITHLRSDCRFALRLRFSAQRLGTHRLTRLAVHMDYLGSLNLRPAAVTRHARAN